MRCAEIYFDWTKRYANKERLIELYVDCFMGQSCHTTIETAVNKRDR